MECDKNKNQNSCNCSYEPCARKGLCCACLRYHLKMLQLPRCCFPDDVEKTFDRSFKTFADLVSSNRLWHCSF